jgi:hypothetical protein
MKRPLAVVLLAVLTAGCAFSSAPADAKRKCRSGYKLVGKRCKKVRKQHKPSTSNAIAAKTFSGKVGSSTISLAPNAKAKTGSAVIHVSCTSAEGAAVSEANGPKGETVKLYPVVLLQQTFTGSFSDPKSGEAMNWTLTGLWKTATRFEGVFSGSATPAGVSGYGGPGCSVPPTNVVLG